MGYINHWKYEAISKVNRLIFSSTGKSMALKKYNMLNNQNMFETNSLNLQNYVFTVEYVYDYYRLEE